VAAGLQPERLRGRWPRSRGRRRGARGRCDVSDPAAIEALAAAAAREGGADILVNNAAIYPLGPWHEADAAQWDAVYATNVRGYFLSPRPCAPQMLARGGGAIVNVASVTFYWGEALLASYVASRAR
jgi:NAD(P)-dependent dehydrogenase (short-subunit alcohol dehydrogenase family)